jgi:oligopeptide transport system permease protein
MSQNLKPIAPPAVIESSPNQRAWRRFARHRPALLGGLFLCVVLLVVVFGPSITPYQADQLSGNQFSPPSFKHWFGTDVHGRDLFSRVLIGTRISLMVGAVGAGVSLVIGVVWGAAAGYLGGRWDSALMRSVDVLYSLPSIVFVIVLMTTLEQPFKQWLARYFSPEVAGLSRWVFLFAGLGAVSWLTMARIVRGQVLSLRHRPFVEASRALGAPHWFIFVRHILPNVSGVVITYLALTVPTVVLSESFLSYLGLGVLPPQASLGSLIADGAGQINPIRVYWWLIVLPGAVLVAILLALNFLGDGLREASDPRGQA